MKFIFFFFLLCCMYAHAKYLTKQLCEERAAVCLATNFQARIVAWCADSDRCVGRRAVVAVDEERRACVERKRRCSAVGRLFFVFTKRRHVGLCVAEVALHLRQIRIPLWTSLIRIRADVSSTNRARAGRRVLIEIRDSGNEIVVLEDFWIGYQKHLAIITTQCAGAALYRVLCLDHFGQVTCRVLLHAVVAVVVPISNLVMLLFTVCRNAAFVVVAVVILPVAARIWRRALRFATRSIQTAWEGDAVFIAAIATKRTGFALACVGARVGTSFVYRLLNDVAFLVVARIATLWLVVAIEPLVTGCNLLHILQRRTGLSLSIAGARQLTRAEETGRTFGFADLRALWIVILVAKREAVLILVFVARDQLVCLFVGIVAVAVSFGRLFVGRCVAGLETFDAAELFLGKVCWCSVEFDAAFSFLIWRNLGRQIDTRRLWILAVEIAVAIAIVDACNLAILRAAVGRIGSCFVALADVENKRLRISRAFGSRVLGERKRQSIAAVAKLLVLCFIGRRTAQNRRNLRTARKELSGYFVWRLTGKRRINFANSQFVVVRVKHRCRAVRQFFLCILVVRALVAARFGFIFAADRNGAIVVQRLLACLVAIVVCRRIANDNNTKLLLAHAIIIIVVIVATVSATFATAALFGTRQAVKRSVFVLIDGAKLLRVGMLGIFVLVAAITVLYDSEMALFPRLWAEILFRHFDTIIGAFGIWRHAKRFDFRAAAHETIVVGIDFCLGADGAVDRFSKRCASLDRVVAVDTALDAVAVLINLGVALRLAKAAHARVDPARFVGPVWIRHVNRRTVFVLGAFIFATRDALANLCAIANALLTFGACVGCRVAVL